MRAERVDQRHSQPLPGLPVGRPLRVLLSEGMSTSARQAATALGLAGHSVEVMDPQRNALARFSRFVRRFHRCPPMGRDPEGYRDFVLRLVEGGRFDMLLPIHEQGYLLARVADRLAPHVAVALPRFAAYEQAVGAIGFARLLHALGLPQPRSEAVHSAEALRARKAFPAVVKSEIGTASRGVWIVRDGEALARAADEIERAGLPGPGPGRGVLVQDFVEGPVEHAQAVFRRGRLVGMHAYAQVIRGAGGGPALKRSVLRPGVRRHLARMGAALDWHGALSVDYILRGGPGLAEPVYIDCNPRLVEPMSAALAGVDLLGALLRVSTDEDVPPLPDCRPDVRTRLALQAVMGAGLGDGPGGGSRRAVLAEAWRAVRATGPYAGSREELTPLRLDPPGALPLLGAIAALAVSPRLAATLAGRGWGAHLLTPEAMQRMAAWPAAEADCPPGPQTATSGASREGSPRPR